MIFHPPLRLSITLPLVPRLFFARSPVWPRLALKNGWVETGRTSHLPRIAFLEKHLSTLSWRIIHLLPSFSVTMKFQITRCFDKIRTLWKDSKLSECIEIKNTATFLRYRYRSAGRAQTVFTKQATRNRQSEMSIESLMERAVVSFFLRRFFLLSVSLLRVLQSPFKKKPNKYYAIILNEQLDKTLPDLSRWKNTTTRCRRKTKRLSYKNAWFS